MAQDTSTRHAEIRMQQRGIPPFVVDLLRRFGHTGWHKGARVRSFDKKARKKVAQYLGGAIPFSEKYFGVYIVETADEVTITAAFRQNRLKR